VGIRYGHRHGFTLRRRDEDEELEKQKLMDLVYNQGLTMTKRQRDMEMKALKAKLAGLEHARREIKNFKDPKV
jgi:hypothetical protein